MGFAVDAAVLSLLVNVLGLDPILSRIPSFIAAVTVTWLLHRTHTFVGRSRYRKGSEYRHYLTVQIIGAATNLLVYALVIYIFPSLGRIPVLPLAVGSATALIVNYRLSCIYVFPEPQDGHHENET